VYLIIRVFKINKNNYLITPEYSVLKMNNLDLDISNVMLRVNCHSISAELFIIHSSESLLTTAGNMLYAVKSTLNNSLPETMGITVYRAIKKL